MEERLNHQYVWKLGEYMKRAANILRDHFTGAKKSQSSRHMAGGQTKKISIPSFRSSRMEKKKKIHTL